MARKSRRNKEKDELEQYAFEEGRQLNLLQKGMVLIGTDPLKENMIYVFIAQLNQELHLAGKTEGKDFTTSNKKW